MYKHPYSMSIERYILLNLCYEFSQSNDIVANPIKFQCMVFEPTRFNIISQLFV